MTSLIFVQSGCPWKRFPVQTSSLIQHNNQISQLGSVKLKTFKQSLIFIRMEIITTKNLSDISQIHILYPMIADLHITWERRLLWWKSLQNGICKPQSTRPRTTGFTCSWSTAEEIYKKPFKSFKNSWERLVGADPSLTLRRTSPLRWLKLLLNTARQLTPLQSWVWRPQHKQQKLHTQTPQSWKQLRSSMKRSNNSQNSKTSGRGSCKTQRTRREHPLWDRRAQSQTLRHWGPAWKKDLKTELETRAGKDQSFLPGNRREAKIGERKHHRETDVEKIVLRETLQSLQETRKKQETEASITELENPQDQNKTGQEPIAEKQAKVGKQRKRKNPKRKWSALTKWSFSSPLSPKCLHTACFFSFIQFSSIHSKKLELWRLNFVWFKKYLKCQITTTQQQK